MASICVVFFSALLIKETQTEIARVAAKTDEAEKLWPEYNKTLSIKSGDCAGMANVFWRIAALYGLSLRTNRTAIIGAYFKKCGRWEKKEMTSNFPALSVLYNRPYAKNHTAVIFGQSSWDPDNITKLQGAQKSIVLHGGVYFQAFPYFHQFKENIRKIFEPSTKIQRFIDDYVKNKLQDDGSHKLCIHLRDFEGGRFAKSNVTWTFEAAKFIIQHLKRDHDIKNITAIVFSDNKNHSQKIADQLVNVGSISKACVPTKMNRGTEMVLGQTKCQSMILTTIGSTFGWWMAYFMEEEAQKRVFYSEHVFAPGHYSKKIKTDMKRNYIRPEWKRIRSENGTFRLELKEK